MTARRFFVGSQSLRKLELDGRREVGVIVSNPAAAKKIAAVFEADWAASQPPVAAEREAADAEEPILASAAR